MARKSLGFIACACLSLTGCVSVSWPWQSQPLAPAAQGQPASARPGDSTAPLAGPAVSVVNPIWENRVIFTEDSVNRGAPLAGLACRLYLLSPELTPVLCDGKVQVQVSEKVADQPQPRVLEQWNIDKDTLKRLARKDIFGWGYTLFLPWQTYRQDITHVYMHVAFLPDNGASPVYAPLAIVSLGNEGRVPIIQSRVPAVLPSETK